MTNDKAKRYELDLPRAIAVEFPARVENTDRAVAMVGGSEQIKQKAETKDEPLELRLRPDDPLSHPIHSRFARGENLLLKIEIPTKYLDQAGGDIRKALELSNGSYTVEPSHVLDTSFRFREMADFQYSLEKSPFAQKIDKLITFDLDTIRSIEFEGNVPIGKDDFADIQPPPRFSQMHQPFVYSYRQNPQAVLVDDGKGGSKLVTTTAPKPLDSILLGWDEEVPTGPRARLEEPTGDLKKLVDLLGGLFKERCSWTRKALLQKVGYDYRNILKFALPYVAFVYKSGPFRTAYMRYGVNVKSSPEFAQYQVEHFRVFTRKDEDELFKEQQDLPVPEGMRDLSKTMFRGMPDPRTVQLCDVTDEDLRKLIDNSAMKEEPDFNNGWYAPLDIRIIRKVMRAKLVAFKNHTEVTEDEVEILIQEETAAFERGNRVEGSDSDYIDSEFEDEDTTQLNDTTNQEPLEEPEEQPDEMELDREEEENENGDMEEDGEMEQDGEVEKDNEEPGADTAEKEKKVLDAVANISEEGSEQLKGLFGFIKQEDDHDPSKSLRY